MSKKSTRLEALHNTFKENGILPENIMVNDTLIREIKQYADAVPPAPPADVCLLPEPQLTLPSTDTTLFSWISSDDRCRETLRKRKGCYKKTTEAEHGAVVTREYYITEDTPC